MQFKIPELLYALFLLVIPIIIHLFQLRKFKKVPFTNVVFLKNVEIKTRKSATLKKWLILLTRMLLFTALIFAFAQPYFSQKNSLNQESETVIYLDNSFSMQAKGEKGALLKRAVQDIINNFPENESLSIITNDETFKNTSIKAIQNSLLKLPYSPNQLSLNTILLKSESIFDKTRASLKNLVLLSDFQNTQETFSFKKDTLLNMYAVKLKPVNHYNITIDSAYIINTTPNKNQLNVLLKNNGKPIENLPVSLFNNETLLAKTSTPISDNASVTFNLPANEIINGKITINDTHLTFDNVLHFNINVPNKVNVLSIDNADGDFLNRIFLKDEFNLVSTTINSLNYNTISQQNVIILNELKNIPNALITVLKSFSNNGGVLLIIPALGANIDNYNMLLSNYNLSFASDINYTKRITSINFSHPLYANGVFESKVSNFQYPKVASFFNLKYNTSAILSFEDGKPFLINNKNTFLLTAPINKENSNFKQSPLIVPTFYNIGRYGYAIPQLYYNIGANNTYAISTELQQDGVLTLKSDNETIIPQQKAFRNKVEILTNDTPNTAGTYDIMNNEDIIYRVSYNYDRAESELVYRDIEGIPNINKEDTIEGLFETLKSNTQINALWKWFVIFALIMLIMEMLILKYFK